MGHDGQWMRKQAQAMSAKFKQSEDKVRPILEAIANGQVTNHEEGNASTTTIRFSMGCMNVDAVKWNGRQGMHGSSCRQH